MKAYDVSMTLSKYGDVYVVKDSKFSCFVEFHFLDEGSGCKSMIELANIIRSDEKIKEHVLDACIYEEKDKLKKIY